MGGTSSSIKIKALPQEGTNQYLCRRHANNAKMEMSTNENEELKGTLDSERENRGKGNRRAVERGSIARDPELRTILNLYEELPAFGGKIESTKRNVERSLRGNANDLEVEELKRENAQLYGKLKQAAPDRRFRPERSDELREFERQLNERKEGVRREVSAETGAIKREMREAAADFADRIEGAVSGMEAALAGSKGRLEAIAKRSETVGSSPIYERIKNVLLQQKNSLLKEMVALNVALPDSSNANRTTIPKTTNIDTKKKINTLNLNESIQREIVKLEKSSRNKVVLLNVPEGGDDKIRACLVLQTLTQLNLDKLMVYRLAKATQSPCPMVVVFETTKYVDEVLRNQLLLNHTGFRGIRIIEYGTEFKDEPAADKNLAVRDAEVDKTGPHGDPEDERSHKIVLFYVAEGGDDRETVLLILGHLTKLPLKNVHVARIGSKSDNKIRPVVVSFDSAKYVSDALTNRYSLKDTPFKGTKVVKFKKPVAEQKESKGAEDTFPF